MSSKKKDQVVAPDLEDLTEIIGSEKSGISERLDIESLTNEQIKQKTIPDVLSSEQMLAVENYCKELMKQSSSVKSKKELTEKDLKDFPEGETYYVKFKNGTFAKNLNYRLAARYYQKMSQPRTRVEGIMNKEEYYDALEKQKKIDAEKAREKANRK